MLRAPAEPHSPAASQARPALKEGGRTAPPDALSFFLPLAAGLAGNPMSLPFLPPPLEPPRPQLRGGVLCVLQGDELVPALFRPTAAAKLCEFSLQAEKPRVKRAVGAA